MAFVSGAFTATFKPAGGAAADIGRTEDGFEITDTFHVQQIRTDDAGESVVDEVHQGSDTMVRLTWAEYPAIKAALFTAHPLGEHKTNVGKLLSALAGQLVLTPVTGTPAATEATAGKSYIFDRAHVEGDVRVILTSKHRKGPITFRCLPNASSKTYTIDTTPV